MAARWYRGMQCHHEDFGYSLMVAPSASTSASPEVALQYSPEYDDLCDTDATSTLVGESAKTSPSMSTTNTPLHPDDTTEYCATPAPSVIRSPILNKRTREKPRKREMNEDRRRINLEEDLYAADVRPKSVQCTECLREIRLVCL